MINAVSGVSNLAKTQKIQFKGEIDKPEEVGNTDLLSQPEVEDSFEKKHIKGQYELTKEDKQTVMQKARANASGWAIFGGIFSTLYYGLRSNKTVAKKYNLDPIADKKFIKKIKKQQMLWTIPGIIYGPGSALQLVAWIYNKNINPEKVDV